VYNTSTGGRTSASAACSATDELPGLSQPFEPGGNQSARPGQ
jgi:hypothetical protein